MSTVLLIVLVLAGMLLSWLATGAVRRYALSNQLLDLPNARSSHNVPTPRGGGLAIVLTFVALIVGGLLLQGVDPRLCTALVGSGLLVAALGWVDDYGHVAARWRLLGHVAAAAWLVAWMGPMPRVPFFGIPVQLGTAAILLSVLFVVWSINMFNFMDGIDGIAGLEGCLVSLYGGLLSRAVDPAGPWPLALLFTAAVCGFLAWNAPPAKIFMGDVGSGFVGLITAGLALWCSQRAPELFWAWFILLGCFMVDATTTLLRRVRRGYKFHEAHRAHAYQYAARLRGSHKPVTLAYGLVTTAWLLPLAAAVAFHLLDGVTGVLIAYTPLVVAAYRLHAGAPEHQKV